MGRADKILVGQILVQLFGRERQIKELFKDEESRQDVKIMEKILVQILDDEVYKIIARKTAGMYFGETAMKSKDCIRTATIISSGLCHVAIIKKDTFDEVLKQSIKAFDEHNKELFKTIPIFQGLNLNHFMKQMVPILYRKKFLRNHYVFKQG